MQLTCTSNPFDAGGHAPLWTEECQLGWSPSPAHCIKHKGGVPLLVEQDHACLWQASELTRRDTNSVGCRQTWVGRPGDSTPAHSA